MEYPIGMTCQQLVELVTDYLEDALPADARARFETHLGGCPGCVEYLEQLRHTIQSTGRLGQDSLDPPVRDALLDVFRTWKRSST